jgi:hypothetical protein
MKCNRLFNVALTYYGITDGEVADAALGPGLTALLNDGVVEWDGLLLLRRHLGRLETASFEDEIGTEAELNEFNIDDYEHGLGSLREQFVQALKLASEFPNHLPENRKLDVLFAISLDDPAFCPPVMSDDPSLPSCNVCFHQLWLGQSWLSDDLEDYAHEALATYVISRDS